MSDSPTTSDLLEALLAERNELLGVAEDLVEALDRIMEYAHTGAAVRDVYTDEQPQFVRAKEALSIGRATIAKVRS